MDVPSGKTVLILKSTPKGLAPLESYLKIKQWDVQSTADIAQAMKILFTKHPTHVLISLDHPQKKIKTLPHLLHQTFPVRVLVFSESDKPGVFKGFPEDKFPNLHPPLTGRMVEQYLNQEPPEGSPPMKSWSDAGITEAARSLLAAFEIKDDTILSGQPAPLIEMVAVPEKRHSTKFGDPDVSVEDLQKAFFHSFDPGNGVVKEKLTMTTVISCLPLSSPSTSGYVVVALGQDRYVDEKLITKISKFLMASKSKLIEGNQWMNLQVDGVNFEKWALSSGQLLQRSVHQGNEVAVGFFPDTNLKIGMGKSIKEDMGTIAVSEVRVGSRVDFDLTIYLPTNKRLMFYIPKGAEFAGEQKGRIDRMGIKEFHVPLNQLRNVERYRTQMALEERMTAHKL